jgi:hypothetical protein
MSTASTNFKHSEYGNLLFKEYVQKQRWRLLSPEWEMRGRSCGSNASVYTYPTANKVEGKHDIRRFGAL